MLPDIPASGLLCEVLTSTHLTTRGPSSTTLHDLYLMCGSRLPADIHTTVQQNVWRPGSCQVGTPLTILPLTCPVLWCCCCRCCRRRAAALACPGLSAVLLDDSSISATHARICKWPPFPCWLAFAVQCIPSTSVHPAHPCLACWWTLHHGASSRSSHTMSHRFPTALRTYVCADIEDDGVNCFVEDVRSTNKVGVWVLASSGCTCGVVAMALCAQLRPMKQVVVPAGACFGGVGTGGSYIVWGTVTSPSRPPRL